MTVPLEPQARSRRISTAALARVEGEGAMSVRIRDREVLEVQLRIYEPPRFFEALLKGRSYTEVPDITARICAHLPGRLPDERQPRDRAGVRGDGGRADP
jgi:sulfhydrogenase subunit alpha